MNKTVIEPTNQTDQGPTSLPSSFEHDRPSKKQLWVLVICVLIVYFSGVTDRWWPTPDSALYLGLARSIYESQGYQFNGEFSVTVTPGLPLMLAAIQALFGEQIWLWNLLMTLCGLAALLMIYKVLSLVDSPRVALCVVAATAMAYTFYRYSHRVLTDAPFALLFWAMLYSAIRYQRSSRWWLALVGLLTVMCVCVRAPGLILIGLAALAFALVFAMYRAGESVEITDASEMKN